MCGLRIGFVLGSMLNTSPSVTPGPERHGNVEFGSYEPFPPPASYGRFSEEELTQNPMLQKALRDQGQLGDYAPSGSSRNSKSAKKCGAAGGSGSKRGSSTRLARSRGSSEGCSTAQRGLNAEDERTSAVPRTFARKLIGT